MASISVLRLSASRPATNKRIPLPETSVNRPLIIILAAVLLDAVGIGLIFPILPRLLEDVTHVSNIAPYVGVMYALYAAMQFVFSPVLGVMFLELQYQPRQKFWEDHDELFITCKRVPLPDDGCVLVVAVYGSLSLRRDDQVLIVPFIFVSQLYPPAYGSTDCG